MTTAADRPGRILRWGRRAQRALRIIRRASEILDALDELDDRIRKKRRVLESFQSFGNDRTESGVEKAIAAELRGMEEARGRFLKALREIA